MLEIVIEPRRTFNLRQAVSESIKAGDYTSLYDDIRDCFTEPQVETIEEMLDSGDIGEAINEIVEEWNGEDVDELCEIIENFFAESSIEIQFIYDEEFEEETEMADTDFEDEIVEPEEEFEPEEEEEL